MNLNQIRSKYFPCVSLLWALLVANPMLMRVLLFSGKPFEASREKESSPSKSHYGKTKYGDKIAPCGRKKYMRRKENAKGRLSECCDSIIPLVIVESLYDNLGIGMEVNQYANWEFCSDKIGEKLLIFLRWQFFYGFAFNNDIPSISWYHYVHFQIRRHLLSSEFRMMLIFFYRF